MSVRKMILGPVQTNVYFYINDDTKEAVLIDPADNPERILEFAGRNGINIKAICLTHGHFDHVMGLKGVQDATKAKVYACREEKRLLTDDEHNLSSEAVGVACTVEDYIPLSDGDVIEEAGKKLKLIFTPGHTEGSCCYYIEDEKILFSGDTLFCCSVGRTDLPTGSSQKMLDSLNKKLLVLPEDVRVYPGHGEETDIGYEKKYNPFVG